MARMSFRKGVNVTRVVSKIAATVLALYVGGTIINEFGAAMNGTTSPFYTGLTLIGWTVSSNQITAYSGSGVLAVVGLIGIGSVIMEFVNFSL